MQPSIHLAAQPAAVQNPTAVQGLIIRSCCGFKVLFVENSFEQRTDGFFICLTAASPISPSEQELYVDLT